MKANYDTVSRKIEYIESTYNVDSIELDDKTKLWNLIRVVLFSYPIKTEYFKHENKNKMKKLIFILKDALSHSKLPKSVKICAVSDVDTQKKIDGQYYDIFMDPLNDIFTDFYVLDWPSAKAERYPTINNHIPLPIPLSILFKKLFPSKPKIYNEIVLTKIIKDFAKCFYLDEKKLTMHVLESITIFKIIKEKMRKKLEKIKPSIIIVRGAYGRFQMGVVQACKELGIKTIELQHGLIIDQHIGYIKKTKSYNRDCVPDFIFTWGDFFSDIIHKGYLFEKNKIISVGFPHIENSLKKNYPQDDDIQTFSKEFESIILVSGQGGGNIEVFIKEAAKIRDSNGFIYKPHPRDVKSYSFEEKNILLVDQKKDIYSLLALVDIHMTVFSTTMLEALAFGVPNILVASDHIDVMDIGVIDNKTTYFVNTPEEMIQAIEHIKKTKDILEKAKNKAEIYFRKDALKNIEKELEIIRNMP